MSFIQANRLFGIGNIDYTTMYSLAYDKYPDQDKTYLNKYTNIKYMDNLHRYLYQRMNINKNNFRYFIGENTEVGEAFKIVRFDKDDNGVVILLSEKGTTLISKPEYIKSIKNYPGYTEDKENFIVYPNTNTWEEFNESYANEHIHFYRIQDMLGKPVYTEYMNDIFRDDIEGVKLEKYKEKSLEQLKEIFKDRSIPESLLKSYKQYYNQHIKDFVDYARKAVNYGVIIRFDVTTPEMIDMIVVEIMPDGSRRYVTSNEACFYFDTESECINLEELNLWQK